MASPPVDGNVLYNDWYDHLLDVVLTVRPTFGRIFSFDRALGVLSLIGFLKSVVDVFAPFVMK